MRPQIRRAKRILIEKILQIDFTLLKQTPVIETKATISARHHTFLKTRDPEGIKNMHHSLAK